MNYKKLQSKRTAILLICFAFSIGVLTFSCNKNDNLSSTQEHTADLLITTSKSYINSIVKRIDDDKADLKTSVSVNLNRQKQSMSNRLLKLNKELNWNKLNVYSKGQDKYIIVPTSEPLSPFTNKEYEFARFAIFAQSRQNAIEMSIIEILTKKGYSLSNVDEIANKAFLNKEYSEKNNFGTLNSYILFYDKAYSPKESYEVRNGLLTSTRVSFRSDLDIKAN